MASSFKMLSIKNNEKQFHQQPKGKIEVKTGLLHSQFQLKKKDNKYIQAFCNKYCKVQTKAQQSFFTKQQLLKIRQKRPKIKQLYKMQPLQLSTFQNAIKDLKEIQELLKQL